MPELEQARSREVAGWVVLSTVLNLEERVNSSDHHIRLQRAGGKSEGDEFTVDCMVDEPSVKYCLCTSSDSPIVIGYLRVRLPGTHIGDAWRALVSREERLMRDPDSEYQVQRDAAPEDPTREEIISYVMRVPWPFYDREVLARRWQLPLAGDDGQPHGVAIVMQSTEDESLLRDREDRVRASIMNCAYLLRPASVDLVDAEGDGDASAGAAQKQDGVEVIVCHQVDLGGACPPWAQEYMTRYAFVQGVQWADKLREHCYRMRRRRRSEGWEVGDRWRGGEEARVHFQAKEGGDCEPVVRDGAPPHDEDQQSHAEMSGQEVLAEIRKIEQLCQAIHAEEADAKEADAKEADAKEADASAGEQEMTAKCLLDEGGVKYYLCASLGSSTVTALLIGQLPDVHMGDAWRALVDTQERRERDNSNEYQLLCEAREGDPERQEVLCYVMRVPWPFCDRDILQRRWQLPLAEDGGLAILMRSIENEVMLPEREDRVRAFVHKSGYLLRPLNKDSDIGVEISVCNQLNMGGLCPPWAQEFLTRLAVSKGVRWMERIREHCVKKHAEREARGQLIGDRWKL